MIQTERLVLRPLEDRDREPLAEINADPEVGYWIGGPFDRAASDAQADRIMAGQVERGFSFWAVERRADGRFIGLAGLQLMKPGLPGEGGFELGWRLARDCHGQGYATEAAAAAKAFAFERLAAEEVLAITAATNLKSQAVMRRIGMVEDSSRAFDHPALDAAHPLRRHVFFFARP